MLEHAKARKAFALAWALAVAIAVAIAAAASPAKAWAAETPTVIYDGAAKTLTIETAADAATASDLFSSFKALMPGDSRSQCIELDMRNLSSAVEVYVQAVYDDSALTQEQRDSLATVTLASSLDGAGLASGTPGSVFAEQTRVATFSSSGTSTMELTLAVPTEVGNEIADVQQGVRWVITVQEADGSAVSSDDATMAKTGDGLGAVVFALLATAASAFVTVAVLRRRRFARSACGGGVI